MPRNDPVLPAAFDAMKNVDIDKLSDLPDTALRPILPCLVRMSLCAPLDTSERWTQERKKILKCLSGIEVVNSLVGLLSIDFHALETDARQELQFRSKAGGNQTESKWISQLEQGLALEFERSDAARKLRLLLSELLFIMSQAKETHTEFYHKQSELFESEVYLEEVSDVLCIAQAELPSLLPVTEVAEALLHVTNGPWLLCRMVSNVPDTFDEVCASLVSAGERQDEEGIGGQRRAEALRMLCVMCPSHALTIRALCVEHCRLPSLAVALTLHHSHDSQAEEGIGGEPSEDSLSDVVAFVSGLLLGSDHNVRTWFGQFIYIGQKKKDSSSMLHALRQELLEQLIMALPEGTAKVSAKQVVQGCAFIRLYCALKGIAAMRFNEEENHVLLRLVTCRPPATSGGVRFICLGLSMLLACPYLLGNTEQERRAIDWIKWLIKEAGRFEREIGIRASFSEMLLLIAIHFHSNQNSAIAELVNSTLGMKSVVKASALSRMKTIFTQEIFTEEIVTSHAIRVPVTTGLSASIQGYLPIHCIYQLLKSRAFSKHKVPINEWILRQLRTCETPIHSVMPNLIDTFINSIIVPNAKTDRTNDPFTEEEILAIFPVPTIGEGHRTKGHELMETDEPATEVISNFTAQILMVYYVLQYQDVLQNNQKNTAVNKVRSYSQALINQLPMKQILQAAQTEQHLYAGLFSPLLRLLATHYPHLCLVEDWMEEDVTHPLLSFATLSLPGAPCTPDRFSTAMSEMKDKPTEALMFLEKLSMCQGQALLPLVEPFLKYLPGVLDKSIPRKISLVCKRVWLRLNKVMPTRLRVMTVNALRRKEGLLRPSPFTEDDITLDPLIVLRCDERVFRCPPVLEITLRVLSAFLVASRSYFSSQVHSQLAPPPGVTVQQVTAEREELKCAMLAAQDSAVVQILLESCLPGDADTAEESGVLSDLREVQGLVCSHVHQMFIADPNLAKLVHFQGYPRELLSLAVAGIPSMHICIDFIPELIAQPHLEKQLFAIELVSYLCLQYALPKSLGVARLAVNVVNTLLTVLTSDNRPDFLLPALPALVRIARTFPPLCDDIVALLTQVGKICKSYISVTGTAAPQGGASSSPSTSKSPEKYDKNLTILGKYTLLSSEVQRTFSEVVKATTTLKHQA